MSATSRAVDAGQAVYTKRTLANYDWLVLGFSNRFVWKCPTRHLLQMYNENISSNHLDVGVGTGFFVDRCRIPGERPRVALLDLNHNCLEAASKRISRYQPQLYEANVLEWLDIDAAGFDSVAINYVLHCLPGTMQSKAVVFENIKAVMNDNGVLFGATILHEGLKRGWMAKKLMAFYNRKGIFTNTDDSLKDLRDGLSSHFSNVSVEGYGCVAVFVAHDK